MKEKIDKTTFANLAGMAGLALGAVSAASVFITVPISGVTAFWATALNWIIWVAKLVGCILIMRAFMLKLAAGWSGVDNRMTRRFGARAALYSAIITAAAFFISAEYVFPDAYTESLDAVLAMSRSSLDSNSLAAFDKMMENLPAFMAVSQFFWCLIYGIILSAILSANIPTRDIFAADADEDDADGENEASDNEDESNQ